MSSTSDSRYFIDKDGPGKVEPTFARTFAALSNAALLEEIQLGKGGADFQAAARAVALERGLAVPS